MAYFRKENYPITNDCQTLDAQISDIRQDLSEVQTKRTNGNATTIRKFLEAKKIVYARKACSKVLEEESVTGTIDELTDRFKGAEERIIIPVDKKRLYMLLSGSAVILLGMYFITKK